MRISEIDLIIIDNVHNLIEKNDESPVFKFFCDESFVIKQLYAELRNNHLENKGFLYYLITGRMNDEDGLFRTIQKKCAEDEEMRRLDLIDVYKQFDYATLLKKVEMTASDFNNIMSLLETNPLPDIVAKHFGLDGYNMRFQTFIGCNSTYEYWSYPPKGYEHLREITNTVCKYLPEKYRPYLRV